MLGLIMASDSHILGRCLYEQTNRIGPRWKDLTKAEADLWASRATEVINKLDILGWRLTYIPPEA